MAFVISCFDNLAGAIEDAGNKIKRDFITETKSSKETGKPNDDELLSQLAQASSTGKPLDRMPQDRKRE